jgi:DNA-binding transcriptional LysR family regulator
VVPTPDGDALLVFARQILETEERLDRFFSASGMRAGCASPFPRTSFS